jgi:hypothetical protein
MKRVLLLTFVVGVLLASLGSRADFEPWLRGPCAGDVKKLCATAPGDRILDCMRAHEKELSPGCKLNREQRRVEMEGAMGGMKKDCMGDVEKFCRQTKVPQPAPQRGAEHGPHGCLQDHLAELSPACKAHFDAIDAHRSKAKDAAKSPAPIEPKAEASPTTSLEQESSDLALAIENSRAIVIGESLSPAERTMTLAMVATRSRENIEVDVSNSLDSDSDAAPLDR